MKNHAAILLFAFYGQMALGQAYPTSNAVWCLSNSSFPGLHTRLQTGNNPDTLINGVVYTRIWDLRWPDDFAWMNEYYVRNGEDGKGYAYLLDSLAEYKTMDLNATVGDTVHDVLMLNEFFPECGESGTVLTTMVVDAVDTITNAGVTVVRHYVRPPCYDLGSFDASRFFWQAGAGTSHGAILQATIGFGHTDPECVTVNDTNAYNGYSNPSGLPGGDPCCHALTTGIGSTQEVASICVTPNPSNGLFTLSNGLKQGFTVFNAQGQFISNGRGPEIDLSAQPTGLYTAVIGTASGQQVVRLVVQRE